MAGTYSDSQVPRARSARRQFRLDHLRACQAQGTSLRGCAAAMGCRCRVRRTGPVAGSNAPHPAPLGRSSMQINSLADHGCALAQMGANIDALGMQLRLRARLAVRAVVCAVSFISCLATADSMADGHSCPELEGEWTVTNVRYEVCRGSSGCSQEAIQIGMFDALKVERIQLEDRNGYSIRFRFPNKIESRSYYIYNRSTQTQLPECRGDFHEGRAFCNGSRQIVKRGYCPDGYTYTYEDSSHQSMTLRTSSIWYPGHEEVRGWHKETSVVSFFFSPDRNWTYNINRLTYEYSTSVQQYPAKATIPLSSSFTHRWTVNLRRGG